MEGIRVYTHNTVVIGSGAAGFNAASRLHQYGQTDTAVITEGVNCGTSRNTGSDKQTYYKLTLSGAEPDSIREMAATLFSGQCVDGDTALCEASLSVPGFLHLVELGVPFPRNRWGEYIGYKTDHDPRSRATSVGPYTSKLMTEALERSVREKGVRIYDGMQAICLLSDQHRVYGVLCIDLDHLDEPDHRFAAFCAKNVVLATGGPAGMYANSVYPEGHLGATGLALAAGAHGQSLTEWQYGLASISPRWNVSGTYMQVLPRFVSTDKNGGDAREFLYDFFSNEGEMLSKVFLKGYQWPFDVRKVVGGSSIIDILVYLEGRKGRRVFLDFRANPGSKAEVDYSTLSEEARTYLEKAGACFGTPFQRLQKMNEPAVAFYADKGVDLANEMLEIALCAQHNNGGVAVNAWWESSVKGLFAAGEAAGTHGVYRPGGSALNAGQVGSTRAAQWIAARGTGEPNIKAFNDLLEPALSNAKALCSRAVGENDSLQSMWAKATARMSLVGAAIRNRESIAQAIRETEADLRTYEQVVCVTNTADLAKVFRLKDILLCQLVYLSAMLQYIDNGGKSRGSAMYSDSNGERPYPSLPEEFTFSLDDGSTSNMVQETWLEGEQAVSIWRPVRPIPEDDDFFENVWRDFRENGNIV